MVFGFKKKGSDAIPFASFWKSLPGLVADGFKFIFPCCFRERGYSELKENKETATK